MTLILLSGTLAIIGVVVGAWLQQRSWKQRHWEEMREKRIKSALATVEDAARLIDQRLYRERRLLWASRRVDAADEVAAARKEYQAALFEWMDNLGRIKAELWHSFGRWAMIRFEREIHDKFASIGRRIEAKLCGDECGSLAHEERQLDALGRTSYEFIHQLLQRIADGELAGLIGRDTVSFENWSNLSVDFLLKRLFGIPT